MLLGAVSAVQTSRLRAFETKERRMAKFSETMDPCFAGRSAAVLQYTQFAYTDEATRRRMNNAATPKPGRFDEEWAKLDLAPMVMRDKAELPEASLILTSVKPELTVGGSLRTRNMLAHFGYEEIKVVHGEEEDQSAGRLIVPKFPDGTRSEEQGPSNSGKNLERDDGQGGSRRLEEPMQQDPDQAEKEDDKASTGGISSLDFNFLSDFQTVRTRWRRRLNQQTRVLPRWNPRRPLFERTGTCRRAALRAILKYRTETLDGITKEKKNRRRCQNTFLRNFARRRVGGAS